MRRWLAGFVFAALAACSPPAQETPSGETRALDLATSFGPYANAWDSDAFSRFEHTLQALTPGPHEVVLSARTNAPGAETVAVYPIGPDGQPTTARLMFVIATTAGNTASATAHFPEDGSGVPVAVIVENGSGRRFAGDYAITVTP